MIDTFTTAPAQESLVPLPPVVAIGASAGGLRSIESFVSQLPADTGMAYVIIQHLSPDYKSLMTEILSRKTDMVVTLAEHGMPLLANNLYLIPPGKELRCAGHTFAVSDFSAGIHRPIDVFFKSLAMLDGTPIAGIVLSGTGSDGTEGIKAIHRVGGMTFSESLESAEFDGMPVSAERTNCVDFVLPPEQIPEQLIQHLVSQRTPVQPPADLAGMQLIFSLLGSRFNMNFDDYKPKTIGRRIERRQQLNHCTSVFQYAEILSQNEEELDELFYDLLIGVTKFFRDKAAFEALEGELEAALLDLPEGETFRVWCAGCATGEEAYSIAMLVLDLMEKLGRAPLLKVFATDMHQHALNSAAAGVYSAEQMEFVSVERQRKYIDSMEGGQFRVSSGLRKHIVFARHNLIQDPPFLNIHLATCRNLLIYLTPQAQEISLTALAFSLVGEGILFLGSSETLGDLRNDFATIDSTWRIYRRLPDRGSRKSPTILRERRAQPATRGSNLLNLDQPETLTVRMLLDIYDAVLRQKVPQGLMLDPKQNVIHVFGDATEFLKPARGRFTGAFKDFIDDAARGMLVNAMVQSQTMTGTSYLCEQVQPDESVERVFDVSITAVEGPAATAIGWVIEFTPTGKQERAVIRVSPSSNDSFELLETELNFTKESLSASIEELEASNEELQATNEEMIASNEELQSTNEELHSVNEELHSVNAEYQRKIDELHEMTSDLENLLATSEIGTVFLGPDLAIRKFTRAATRHFDLMPQDVGRRLSNFTNRLGLPDLQNLMQSVLEGGDVFSRVVRDDFGARVSVRIVPYRTAGVIGGVLVSIVGQTGPSEVSHEIATTGPLGTWDWPDVAHKDMWWSPGCYTMLGLSPGEVEPTMSEWLERTHPEDRELLERAGSSDCDLANTDQIILRMECNGEYRPFELRSVALMANDTPTSLSGLIWKIDLETKESSRFLTRRDHFEQVARDLQDFAYAVSHDLQAPMRQVQSAVSDLHTQLPESSGPEAAAWNVVKSKSEAMRKMLMCLLEYSRVHTDGSTFHEVDVNGLVAKVIRSHDALISEANANIDIGELPSVRGDAIQISRMVWHLVDNALKHSVNPPEIRIAAKLTPQGWLLTVRDNGIGIAAKYHRSIFIIFRRLQFHPEEGYNGDDGFGLALSKRIAERHGGRIWLESDGKNGSTVFVLLPAGE